MALFINMTNDKVCYKKQTKYVYINCKKTTLHRPLYKKFQLQCTFHLQKVIINPQNAPYHFFLHPYLITPVGAPHQHIPAAQNSTTPSENNPKLRTSRWVLHSSIILYHPQQPSNIQTRHIWIQKNGLSISQTHQKPVSALLNYSYSSTASLGYLLRHFSNPPSHISLRIHGMECRGGMLLEW